MRNRHRGQATCLLAFLGVALLLAGCARTSPSSHYQLSALAAAGNDPDTAGPGRMVIGIGPVLLPEYLDRPQLVTRLAANRLHLADSRRWAEPLSANIPRVLGENLSALLGTDRILLHPWPLSTTKDYQLFVEVLQFENQEDGAALLVVRWAVKGRDGGMALPARRSSHRAPAASHDPEGLVAALNEALLSYCREVARELLQSR